MPELRLDPVTNRWVVVAIERAKRPKDFAGDKPAACERPAHSDACPFCPGNETATPPEIFAFRQDGTGPDTEGWWVRGVPNKYPALVWEPTVKPSVSGVFAVRPAKGAHEVVIETPLHNASPAMMCGSEMAEVLRAYSERYQALSAVKDIRYVLIFRNHGKEAGASLEHPHSQIAAVPVVPPVILEELAGARGYYESTGCCVFCDIISQELESGARVVADTPDFVALEPHASKVPFETWVLPKTHAASFRRLEQDQRLELGSVLVGVLGALSRGLHDPPYNYILHTAPLNEPCDSFYHWHFEIFPKLTVAAGFEFGMGIYINVTTPEAAAEFLRKCIRDGRANGRNPGL